MVTYLFAFILAELLVVAYIDFKTKRISNLWAMGNMVVAGLLYSFYRNEYPLSFEVLLFPLGFLVIGFFLFVIGIMGAGDSKYLASLFLMTPPELHLPLFEKILLSTILVGALLLSFKIIKNFVKLKAYLLSHHWQGIKDIIKSRISYAPVILIAWVLLVIERWP